MTLLKKILKRKHIIAQSVCNHPKLEYYYQANNPIEDVTPELEEKALNEIKNNN